MHSSWTSPEDGGLEGGQGGPGRERAVNDPHLHISSPELFDCCITRD